MKIALVHDFLTQLGGAEKVLEALLKIWPEAPVYTLVYNPEKTGAVFSRYDIRPSFINHLPGGIKHYKYFLPLMPRAIESFDLGAYDIILSNCSAYAKGVRTNKKQIHICYLHTPTRYLWQDRQEYLRESAPRIFYPILWLLTAWLRRWDYRAGQRPDIIFGNSQTVCQRIKKYYRRPAEVIYPFVQTEIYQFNPKIPRGDFYLLTGRLVPYKRYDIAIKAFRRLPDKILQIAGDGLDRPRLEKLAAGAPNIQFLGRVSDREMVELYQTCQAYIFPALEDFGITPLEAMACGASVLAFGQGGATETVIAGQTGIFFDQQTPESLLAGLKELEKRPFNRQAIVARGRQFSEGVFIKRIKDVVARARKML